MCRSKMVPQGPRHERSVASQTAERNEKAVQGARSSGGSESVRVVGGSVKVPSSRSLQHVKTVVHCNGKEGYRNQLR